MAKAVVYTVTIDERGRLYMSWSGSKAKPREVWPMPQQANVLARNLERVRAEAEARAGEPKGPKMRPGDSLLNLETRAVGRILADGGAAFDDGSVWTPREVRYSWGQQRAGWSRRRHPEPAIRPTPPFIPQKPDDVR